MFLYNAKIYGPKSNMERPTRYIGSGDGLPLRTVEKLVEVALPNSTFSLRTLGLKEHARLSGPNTEVFGVAGCGSYHGLVTAGIKLLWGYGCGKVGRRLEYLL